jgi:hypothetical protein
MSTPPIPTTLIASNVPVGSLTGTATFEISNNINSTLTAFVVADSPAPNTPAVGTITLYEQAYEPNVPGALVAVTPTSTPAQYFTTPENTLNLRVDQYGDDMLGLITGNASLSSGNATKHLSATTQAAFAAAAGSLTGIIYYDALTNTITRIGKFDTNLIPDATNDLAMADIAAGKVLVSDISGNVYPIDVALNSSTYHPIIPSGTPTLSSQIIGVYQNGTVGDTKTYYASFNEIPSAKGQEFVTTAVFNPDGDGLNSYETILGTMTLTQFTTPPVTPTLIFEANSLTVPVASISAQPSAEVYDVTGVQTGTGSTATPISFDIGPNSQTPIETAFVAAVPSMTIANTVGGTTTDFTVNFSVA